MKLYFSTIEKQFKDVIVSFINFYLIFFFKLVYGCVFIGVSIF